VLKSQRVAVDTLLYPGSQVVAMQLANGGYLISLFASGGRAV
jgi:aconitase A